MFQGESVFCQEEEGKKKKINGLNQNIQLWNFQSFRVENSQEEFIHSFSIRVSKQKDKTENTCREAIKRVVSAPLLIRTNQFTPNH